jgi:hypothetical protein
VSKANETQDKAETPSETVLNQYDQYPAHTRAGLEKMHAGLPLVGQDKGKVSQDVISRYMDGEQIKDIAVSYGLKSPERIYQVLAEAAEEQWKSAQAARALAEYDQAEEAVKTASDALGLARAREHLRSQQWKLERVLRRIYGQEQHNHLGSGTVTINISTDLPKTIDVTPEKGEE